MAEIRVQPKRKNYWWVWVLLVIVVAGVLWYLSEVNMLPGPATSNSDSTVMNSPGVTDTASNQASADSSLYFHNGITGQ